MKHSQFLKKFFTLFFVCTAFAILAPKQASANDYKEIMNEYNRWSGPAFHYVGNIGEYQVDMYLKLVTKWEPYRVGKYRYKFNGKWGPWLAICDAGTGDDEWNMLEYNSKGQNTGAFAFEYGDIGAPSISGYFENYKGEPYYFILKLVN